MATVTPEYLEALYKLRDTLRQVERGHYSLTLQPYQQPPDGDWWLWLFLAGRGTGKTVAGAHYVTNHVLNDPPCLEDTDTPHRVAIIAPTLTDARVACVEGPLGLLWNSPDAEFNRGNLELRWPNGSYGKLFGASGPDDLDRLRAGGNTCLAWAEEMAAWRHLDNLIDYGLLPGLRQGPRPRIIATTTPKPRKRIIEWADGADGVVVTRARTSDNPHLPDIVKRELYDRYGGTRVGRQELDAEILTEVEGALWTFTMLQELRVDTMPPTRPRVLVGVDPAASATSSSSWTGIVVACQGGDGDYYVLADRSCRLSPEGWARQVVEAYDEFQADRVVAEVNQGGDMVESVLRRVARELPVQQVRATRGKAVRAEPVAALYEQGRVHHVGILDELEAQMTSYTPDRGWVESPDRVDALVWALTALSGRGEMPDLSGLTSDMLGVRGAAVRPG